MDFEQMMALNGATKKKSDFINFNLYSKKDDSIFLGTLGLLPNTKEAMLSVLSQTFVIKPAGVKSERTVVSASDII